VGKDEEGGRRGGARGEKKEKGQKRIRSRGGEESAGGRKREGGGETRRGRGEKRKRKERGEGRKLNERTSKRLCPSFLVFNASVDGDLRFSSCSVLIFFPPMAGDSKIISEDPHQSIRRAGQSHFYALWKN